MWTHLEFPVKPIGVHGLQHFSFQMLSKHLSVSLSVNVQSEIEINKGSKIFQWAC